MEHNQRIINKETETFIYPHEYEQASNSYLMSVVSVMAGTFIPIVNFIAAVIFYLGSRKSSYFVRWHAIQSALGQMVLIPFNAFAFAWTLRVLFHGFPPEEFRTQMNKEAFFADNILDAPSAFWLYIALVLLLNVIEFFVTIYAAINVRKGHNVRWAVIAPITDRLTSKENRDIYIKNA